MSKTWNSIELAATSRTMERAGYLSFEEMDAALPLMEDINLTNKDTLVISVPRKGLSDRQLKKLLSISPRISDNEGKIEFIFPYTRDPDTVKLRMAQVEKICSVFRKDESICPKCGKGYSGYLAISRGDNKTPICPECGTREALNAAGISSAEQDAIIKEIYGT